MPTADAPTASPGATPGPVPPPTGQPEAVCPDCRAPLTGAPSCPACGLPLTGEPAARLWQVDLQLRALTVRRDVLLTEREQLLSRLRASAYGTAGAPGPTGPGAPADAPLAGAPAEASTRSVQNTLLALGALLLAVAAVVFAAVTYRVLGPGGRAAVLVTLTVTAAYGGVALSRRGLTASAETAAGIAGVLALLDAYGLRTLGLGAGLDGVTYSAVAIGVVAALAAGYALAVPLRLPRRASVGLAQLPALLLAAEHDAGLGAFALVLAVVAAIDVTLWRVTAGRPVPYVHRAAGWCALPVAALALLPASGGAEQGQGTAALALLVLAATAAYAGSTGTAARGRLPLSAVPVPLVAAAGWTVTHLHLGPAHSPLVLAATALAATGAAALLPRDRRPGPLLGAVALAALTAATQARAVAEAAALPLAWPAQPWTLRTHAARSALSPWQAWTGTAQAPALLLAAAAVGVLAWHLLQADRRRLLAAGAPAVAALVVLAPALGLSYATALALLLAAAAALVAAGAVVRPAGTAAALPAAGAGLALLCATWSTADRTATLVVLPACALLAVAGALLQARALPRGVAVGAAGLLAGAALGAYGAAAGLARDQVGALLPVAVAVLLALAAGLARRARPVGRAGSEPAPAPSAAGHGAEVASVVLAVTAVALAEHDPGWRSWTLAALGLLALATALRPDRRPSAAAGALLLSASSWVRLAAAGVTAPEPYVLPLAALALLLGHLRRRSAPQTGSYAAYGPGLSLLLPSLSAALQDAGLARPLLLGLVALAVLLVGVRRRLRAPLVGGGAVLAVDALHLLAPYAAALPRWLPLALAGAVLLGLGATYEQRRRDLAQLRQRYGTLA